MVGRQIENTVLLVSPKMEPVYQHQILEIVQCKQHTRNDVLHEEPVIQLMPKYTVAKVLLLCFVMLLISG